MKRNIIFLIFTAILLLNSTITYGYYKDQYWECSRSGEKSYGDFYGRYPSSNLFDNNGICKKSCCVLCTARYPMRDCFGSNAHPMCSCAQGTSTDTSVPILILNSPVGDFFYSKRGVNVDVAISELVRLEYIDNQDLRSRPKSLCKSCNSFNRNVNFKEGLNDITISATDRGGNKDEETIKFIVDSKKPQISKVEPTNNKYGKGEFKIYYSEDNLKQIKLTYREGNSLEYKSVGKNNCENGSRKECIFNVPDLQNGELFYSFEVEDIAGTKAVSKELNVLIDTISPVISLDPSLLGDVKTYTKKLPLSLNISEKVDLSYKDLNGNNRFLVLCRNCNAYNKAISFRTGTHNIVIQAADKAGNSDEENLIFSIA